MNKGVKQMLRYQNGRVMDPKSGLDQVCDVLVQDGKIVKICSRNQGRRSRAN